QDVLVSAGYTFYNSIPDFIAPALEVKEAYGELRIPLLKDIPLIRELTVTGAGRLSNYNNKTGTVYSYNGSVIWRPVNDLTLRASYARAVRAPNLGELYTPAGTNFATVKDPCSSDQLSQGPNPANRKANCAAAGIPAGYFFQYSNSLQYLSGGNPNLKAETSDSYTFGGVFQP
ncbi:TonB-dependent receptor domain-containing protein, partial [Pseudomonas proteolytica]|uniref:TonB-dependent receptor domain-containing protein n=2 Tax=Pseudomonadota TaxID=1224 RepID=UPI0030D874F2